ncbi:MAG: hypothetical protein IPQ08_00850 [Chitinophagaceae bacterium]|nr:hypothetical protein [Chitinophagaceae bacterium]
MSKFPFTLLPDETIIDTWTIIYMGSGDLTYNGKLTVTNKRLLYDAKYDVSAKGILTEAMFVKWGSEGYLTIERSEIGQVDVEKKFLAKKVILTLKDGSRHIFNYGVLNIDKLVAALNS